MTENKTEFKAEAAYGKLTLRKDKTHWRAYNADNKQVGEAFMDLNMLLNNLDARLEGNEKPPTVEEPGKVKPVEKKLGEAETKEGVKFIITHDGFHFRARKKDGGQVMQPYMRLNDLLPAIGAKAYVGMDPEVERQTPHETAEKPVGDKPDTPPTEAQQNLDRSKCGQFKNSKCGMDGKECDGQCGEHAARAKAKAQEKEKNK